MDPEYELWKKVTTVFMNKCHFRSFNFPVIVMFLLLLAQAFDKTKTTLAEREPALTLLIIYYHWISLLFLFIG